MRTKVVLYSAQERTWYGVKANMGGEWMQVFKERADGALLDPPYQRSELSIAL